MFDAYYKWLGILPKDQPPNHYRLLSLEQFEPDLDVIEGAADRAMGYIRQYQAGEHAALAAKLLNEIATARLCLLKSTSKADYDAKIRKKLVVQVAPPASQASHEFDADLAQLMNAPQPSRRLRRKNSKQPPGVWIAAGIVIACLVLGVLMTSFGGRPGKNADPINRQVTAPPAPQSSAQSLVKSPEPVISIIKPRPKIALLESKLFEVPAGPSIDLLQGVDFSRDTLSGGWKREGPSFLGGPNGTLYLQAKIPSDYRLTFTVKRVSGTDCLLIGFPIDGRIGAMEIDGFNSTLSGLYVDNYPPNANCTAYRGQVFRNNETAKIVITVHPGHVQSSIDGKTIVDWYGNADRLIAFSGRGEVNRELPFLTVVNSPFQIESAVMNPIQTEPSPDRIAKLDTVVDLMPVLDTGRDGHRGVWTLSDNVLHSPDARGWLSLPVPIPEEYTLSAMVELPSDSRAGPTLVIGLLAGSSCCTIALGNDDYLGLEKIDGIRWDANQTRLDGPFLKKGQPAKIDCTVTQGRIRMEIDGRTLVDWTRDVSRLSLQDDWAPVDARKLFYAANMHFKFHEIKLGPPIDPPKLPSHPPLTVGRSLDLLALVDPLRDTIAGRWTKDAGQLRTLGDTIHPQLNLPCEIPDDYKLTLVVAREQGGMSDVEHLLIGFPTASSKLLLYLDAYNSTISSLTIDGTDLRSNLTTYRQTVIPPGLPTEIVCLVRKTGVKVITSGKTIIDWTGSLERGSLIPNSTTPGPGRRIALQSHGQRFRFEKIELEPLEPASFPAVAEMGSDGNLLSVIEPNRDSRKGEWKLDKTGLVSPSLPTAWIRLPVDVPEQYVLTATVERRSGDGRDFFLGLLVGGHPCLTSIDGQLSAGLAHLDGKSFYDAANPTRRTYSTPLLPLNNAVKIIAYVLPNTVIVMCGNKEVVRWHGDPRRLNLGNAYKPPNYASDDRDHLWLGAWESDVLVRELTLKPLDNEAARRISNEFVGVFPQKVQANVPLKEVTTGFEDGVPQVSDKLGSHPAGKAAKSSELLPKGKAIDLLEMVRVPDHSITGIWSKRDGIMVCEPSATAADDARFMVPIALRGSYELNCEFTPRSNDHPFTLVFPTGFTACSMTLCFEEGKVSGFGTIDQLSPIQLPPDSTAVIRTGTLVSGKRYQLQVDVIQNDEQVVLKSSLDGQRLATWKGKVAQLSCLGLQALPSLQSIGVIVGQSAAEIHKLDLLIKSDGKAYRLGNDWQNPLSAAAPAPPKDAAARCLTWKGRKYFISDDIMSLPSAQKIAAQWHGRLLTISSKEEESFIYEQGRARKAAFLWTSGWRHDDSKQWRDERNRPTRFSPTWAPRQPDFGVRELVLLYNNAQEQPNRGMHDAGLYDNAHACIEWGNEYSDDE